MFISLGLIFFSKEITCLIAFDDYSQMSVDEDANLKCVVETSSQS